MLRWIVVCKVAVTRIIEGIVKNGIVDVEEQWNVRLQHKRAIECCVLVCVCLCVCARTRVCVRMCVCLSVGVCLSVHGLLQGSQETSVPPALLSQSDSTPEDNQ